MIVNLRQKMTFQDVVQTNLRPTEDRSGVHQLSQGRARSQQNPYHSHTQWRKTLENEARPQAYFMEPSIGKWSQTTGILHGAKHWEMKPDHRHTSWSQALGNEARPQTYFMEPSIGKWSQATDILHGAKHWEMKPDHRHTSWSQALGNEARPDAYLVKPDIWKWSQTIGILGEARHMAIKVNLRQKLVFSDGVQIRIRSEIIIWSTVTKKIILMELTVLWEYRLEEAYDRKKAKCENLAYTIGNGLHQQNIPCKSQMQRLSRKP